MDDVGIFLLVIAIIGALLLGPAAFVLVLIQWGMRRRVRELERQIAELEARIATGRAGFREAAPTPASAPQPVPVPETRKVEPVAHPAPPQGPPAPSAPVPPPAMAAPPPLPPRAQARSAAGAPPGAAPGAGSSFLPAGWSERKAMVAGFAILGGIAILTACGFFLKYAIEQGILGPHARLLIGLLSALALVVAGERARVRSAMLGNTLGGVGIGVLYFCLWAGDRVYGILPLAATLPGAALTAGTASLAAAQRRSRLLAWMAQGGAWLLLVGWSHPDTLGSWTLLYALVLAAGAAFLVRATGWADLGFLAAFAALLLEAQTLSWAAVNGWTWAASVAAIHGVLVWGLARCRSLPGEVSRFVAAAALAVIAGFALLATSLGEPALLLPLGAISALSVMGVLWLLPRAAGWLRAAVWLILAIGMFALASEFVLTGQCTWSTPLRFLFVLGALGLPAGVAIAPAIRHGKAEGATLVPALAGCVAWIGAAVLHLKLWWLLVSPDGGGIVLAAHAVPALLLFLVCRTKMAPLDLPLAGGKRVMLALGILFLGFATAVLPVELDYEHLAVALALEAGALAAMAWSWRSHEVMLSSLACMVWSFLRLATALPTWMSPHDGEWPVLNWRLYAWGIPAASALVQSIRLSSARPAASHPLAAWRMPMRVLLAMLGMVTSFAWLNLECTAWFRTGGWIGPDVNSMWQGLTRSLLWLFFGSVLVLWGLIRRRKPVRWSGLVVLVLSTVKVFIVDVWDLEALYRVGSFVALGLVLLLGAWVYSRAAGVLDREEGVGPDSKEVA